MLDQLIKQAGELPPLPEVYIRVTEVLESEISSGSDIGKALQSDPALTARVLKLINSAFYGLHAPVSSIPQAVTLLGREQLKQVLLGSVLSGVFKDFSVGGFPLRDFWQHCIKSAIIARQLAMQNARVIDHEAFFTIGLLHDIGWLVIAKVKPGVFEEISETSRIEGKDVVDIEMDRLGLTHIEVGVALLKKWKMPNLIVECVKNHHHKDPQSAFILESSIVYLANQLSRFELNEISDKDYEYEEGEADVIMDVLEGIPGWEDAKCTSEQISVACELADEQWLEVMETLGMNNMNIDIEGEVASHFNTNLRQM